MNSRITAAVILGAIIATGSALADQRPDAGRVHEHVDVRYGRNQSYLDRGVVVGSLPHAAAAVSYGPDHYWFSDGTWYRAQGARFVVTAPPIGIIVPVLPTYYVTVMIGGIPYYYANDTHYVWRNSDHGYQVVEPPPGADAAQVVTPATAAAGAQPTGPDSVFIYPDRGQSAGQQEKDRAECHRWAAGQAGLDPNHSVDWTSVENPTSKSADYFRAMNACLTARDYTVR